MTIFMPWTDDRKAEVKRRWLDGQSAGEIARAIRHTTRNAVIGIVYRNGWTRTPECTTATHLARKATAIEWRAPKLVRPPQPKAEPKPRRVYDPDAPVSLELSIEGLSSKTCKWPSGDGPFTFCGHKPLGAKPYCSHHAGRAYTRETGKYTGKGPVVFASKKALAQNVRAA